MPSLFDESVDRIEGIPSDCLFDEPCHARNEVEATDLAHDRRVGLAINEDQVFDPRSGRYYSQKSANYLYGRTK